MDASVTRRGQPCWYKVEGISTIAVNDAFLLRSALFVFLKAYFSSKDYYVHLLHVFNEVRGGGRPVVRHPTVPTNVNSLLSWFSIPSGFLVVFEKPNRSSCTFTHPPVFVACLFHEAVVSVLPLPTSSPPLCTRRFSKRSWDSCWT